MPRPKRFPILWTTAFTLSLGFIGVGLWLGEVRQVLLNAASICLACMGIG